MNSQNNGYPSIRKLKPINNSSRNTVLINKRHLGCDVEKSLSYRKFNKGGRNNTGKITVRARGGGNHIRIRMVSHKFDQGEVIKTVIDPNRSCPISLIKTKEGDLKYIPSRTNHNVYTVSSLSVKDEINTIETYPGSTGRLVRSAGTFATIKQMEEGSKHVVVKMRSGEIRRFHKNCKCYLGRVPFEEWRQLKWGKAGRKVNKNKRPLSCGQAQNRTDHPNGGENSKHKPKVYKTYKGKLARGKKYKFKINPLIIKTRRGVIKRKI